MRFHWLGARSPGPPVAEGRRDATTHYYGGAQHSAWQTGIPQYERVRFPSLYPGVDLVWRGRPDGVEYEFHVDPGSDPRRIRFQLAGARHVRVDRSGNLVADTASGRLYCRRPAAYQDSGSRLIGARFEVDGSTVGFRLAPYDRSKPLVIDPLVTFSASLGGSGFDAAYATASDSAGNIYITGETASSNVNLTGTATASRANRDIFVAKISPDRTSLVYTVVLAGPGNDAGRAIAVDTAGDAYVAGTATGAGFPVTPGALRTAPGGLSDAFVARLDATGGLVWSTFLGDSGDDTAAGIAMAPGGGVYVTGYTASRQFPTTQGAPQTIYRGGFYDAFLVRLNASGSALVYSTLLGGSGNDQGRAVVAEPDGGACLTGRTDSTGLASSYAAQREYAGNGDALIACTNPAGNAWTYVSYLGGRSMDEAYGAAIDAAGNLYTSGTTFSSDFPGGRTGPRGDYDAFVAKVNPAGTTLSYVRVWGGTGADAATSVAVDASNVAWAVGYTTSADFPLTQGSQAAYRGGFEAFVTQWSADGATQLFSSYLGGSLDDHAWAVALDGTGGVVVVGDTSSPTYPVTAGSISSSAGHNAFVTQIKLAGPPTAASASPSSGSGARQVFSAVFSDPDGYADIAWALILISPVLDGAHACYVGYDRAANRLYLWDDAGTALLGASAPGSSTQIENSQCRLDAAASTVSSSGSTLTLNAAVTFTPAFRGDKTLYLYAVDRSGNNTGMRNVGTWIVTGSTQPPTALSIAPASGSSLSQTFSAAFSDPDADLAWVLILVAPLPDSRNACYVAYNRPSNRVYLWDDTGANLLGGVQPGASGTIENSQCGVDLATSSVTISGNTLTFNAALRFKASFAGAQYTYSYGLDQSGLNSGLQQRGTWTVPSTAQPPAAVSVSPASGSGLSQTFSASFSDPHGYADITWAAILVSPVLDGTHACYVAYERPNNRLYLWNDSGTALLGAYTPGTPVIIENAQCRVDVGTSAVQSSGSTLVLNVALAFKSGFAGSKQVYLYALNRSGLNSGLQALGTWVVPGSTAPPVAVSVSPSSGSGLTQTFSAAFSDADGYEDIVWALILISPVLDGSGSCYALFDRSSRRVYLWDDSGTALLGGYTLGTATAIDNNQCSLNVAASSLSASGNSMTVNGAFTFKSSFAGAKTVYLYAVDQRNLNSGMYAKGAWTVPGHTQPPTAVSVSPSSGNGSSHVFSATFSDATAYTDIAWAAILISPALDGARACYVTYERAANRVYLWNDAGNALLGGYNLGASAFIENSQCRLDVEASSVSGSGTVLVLNTALAFKSGFAGAKNVYLYAIDRSDLNTGMPLKGSWLVP
ncbi:MAG TPA: SBBP repeat-containing protein [Bryobacteraceae bacterium]|nr:SBBP repeat-containing protein [Bryobacteraceae bacterium]